MSLQNLEVTQLENHLRSGGFLDGFTDVFNEQQPAPNLQINELRLDNLPANERALMIRTTGGITNPSTRHQIKQRSMAVYVVGMQGEGDSIIVNGYADEIERWLVANPQDGACLSNISSSGVSGPDITEDSRRVYEINMLVTFNINRPNFFFQT